METKDLKKLKKADVKKEKTVKTEKPANEAVPLDDAALEKAAGGGLFDDIPRVETHDYDEEVKKNA
jgi:hypothetical protein